MKLRPQNVARRFFALGASDACPTWSVPAIVLVQRGYNAIRLLRGTIVNRTDGTHKNLSIYLFSLATVGPIY